jgi:DNA-binding MarR family transcriptional regulator
MSGNDPLAEALREWVEASMHRSMHAFIRYTRKSALSFSQVNTLFRLHHHGASPVNDLADHLGISMPAVSQLLAPLEETGVIQRTEDPNDRRVKQIALTDKGTQFVQESMSARHGWLDDLTASLSDEDKDQILPALLLLNHYARQLKGKPHEDDPHQTIRCH